MAIGAQSGAKSDAHTSAAEVSVTLSKCRKEDARALFRALGGAFECDRGSAGPADNAPGGHPTVWSTMVDVTDVHGHAEPARLSGPVTADIQGAPHAVAVLKETLAEVFSVRLESLTAGDQEQEVRLRLENRTG